MRVYQCEDSLEGIFTAIFTAYEEKQNPRDTRISLSEELFLFAEHVSVIPHREKTFKVMNTLKKQFGEEDYLMLCLALSSSHEKKAQAVYQTVAAGLKARCARGHLFDNLADDWVNLAFCLARGANNENQHLRGFLRFQELENGVLFARIGPKNNLLTFLMPHFADRMPLENFMIYDEARGLFGIHPAKKQWYLVREDVEILGFNGTEDWGLSKKEREYQELFRTFCHKMAVEGRENRKLQQNMLPLRFQEYMVEFQ